MVAEQLRRPVPGGIGSYLRGLLQGLDEIGGVDVTLFDSSDSRLPSKLVTRLWDRGVLAAPSGYDVVHAPSLLTMSSAAPLSVTVHDLAWREAPETFPWRGRRWHNGALRRSLGRAQAVVVPSHRTARMLAQAVGGRDRRIHVIEEGSDHLPPPDRDGAAKLLARLGVGESPYLLTLSTLEPRKNLPRLLEAYRAARPRLPEPWPLVVVGPEGWGPELPPAEGVVLAGFVDEEVKSALLAGARLLVYVPLLEGFGLPPLEAMAAGAPVVATDMPSIGDAALVVSPADVVAMADGIVQAATDDVLRARLISAGSRRAAELTWSEAARRHMAVWESMCR
jgi:glycosyltransferase involved in cell wall biosynthesis